MVMNARRRPFNMKPPSRNPAVYRGPKDLRLKPPSILLTYGQADAVARSLPPHMLGEFTRLTRVGRVARPITLDELRGVLRQARDHHLQAADAATSSAEKTRLGKAARVHVGLLTALATANTRAVSAALTRFAQGK